MKTAYPKRMGLVSSAMMMSDLLEWLTKLPEKEPPKMTVDLIETLENEEPEEIE